MYSARDVLRYVQNKLSDTAMEEMSVSKRIRLELLQDMEQEIRARIELQEMIRSKLWESFKHNG